MRVHVVGSGPNGLAAAVILQRAGCAVTLHERAAECGGGVRTLPLTLPGYLHDVCSAVHPLAVASPFFRSLPLAVDFVQPPVALAHPFDDGTAALLQRGVRTTAATLDRRDTVTWERLFAPLAAAADPLLEDVLAPLRWPRHPALFARFARLALHPATELAERRFRGARARALFAGLAAHGTLPLDARPSAAFGVVLALTAHARGWPIVRGGSQRIADALLEVLRSAGGEVRTSSDVQSLENFGDDPVVLDTAPAAAAALAAARLTAAQQRRLRGAPRGPGVHKVEWVLRSPVPWRAAACAGAGTVHLGGNMAEIAAALRAAAAGRMPARPFVLLGQPTQFDGSRAPAGGHVAWAYSVVPNGSMEDHTPAIEAQVERFAPGFRDCISARHVRTAAAAERENPNQPGGSIAGSVHSLTRFFLGPAPGRSPYRLRRRSLYLCSAATPPGPGVHGMCGAWAARTLLRDLQS